MNIKKALLEVGYTEREAENQMKRGAWLYSLSDYVDMLRGNKFDEEEIAEVTEAYNKYDKTTVNFSGELDLIVVDGKKYILEKSL